MNLNFVKIGKGPDFVMTYGRTEVMHRIRVGLSGGPLGRTQVLTLSNRSFHQCQIELHRFLNMRADETGWRIGHMDTVTGNCRIQVGCFQCKIAPMFPDKIWPAHRNALVEIFTDNLNILERNQTR